MPVENIAVFIPIVAIVMGIGIGMLALWSEHKRKALLLEQVHRERMMALEKGVDPPALPQGLVGFVTNKNQAAIVAPKYLWPKVMRNGIALLFCGVVLAAAIEVAGGHEGALFALIPAAIGVANLIYAAVLWHQEKDQPPRAVRNDANSL